jgi:hypothetical protein
MVDDQAVLAFLQHLDLVLSAALRGDEQQRLRRLEQRPDGWTTLMSI